MFKVKKGIEDSWFGQIMQIIQNHFGLMKLIPSNNWNNVSCFLASLSRKSQHVQHQPWTINTNVSYVYNTYFIHTNNNMYISQWNAVALCVLFLRDILCSIANFLIHLNVESTQNNNTQKTFLKSQLLISIIGVSL